MHPHFFAVLWNGDVKRPGLLLYFEETEPVDDVVTYVRGSRVTPRSPR
jgi:hypothetical protein